MTKQSKGYGKRAATMAVTIALEEVRRHKGLSRDVYMSLNPADQRDYIELARVELGVTNFIDVA